jgi:hypothetical protein
MWHGKYFEILIEKEIFLESERGFASIVLMYLLLLVIKILTS